MLTKDHIKLRLRGERIYPDFLQESPSLLADAERLIEVFRGAVGEEQVVVDDRLGTEGGVNGAFGKLVADQCEWTEAEDRASQRCEWFRLSEACRNQSQGSYDAFRAAFAERTGRNFDAVVSALYDDLPAKRRLTKIPDLTSSDLVHRYNIAQVQGALLSCQDMVITVRECDPVAMRPLFRTIKFHRLLPQIEQGKAGEFTLRLDGPMSLLSERNAYGSRFANFFPSLVSSGLKWEMVATIIYKKAKRKLRIAASDGYLSKRRLLQQYDPPEFRLLVEQFADEPQGIRLERGGELLSVGDQICFPDFTMRFFSGDTRHLELFHKWHKTPLLQRLANLEKCPRQELLIGVEAKLAAQTAVRQALANSTWFQEHGFVFRDFPTRRGILELTRRGRQVSRV